MPNKDKERILQAARERQLVAYRSTPIRQSTNFSTETLQARRVWHNIFKVMKSNNLQPRLCYPAKLSIKIESEITSFPDRKKLKDLLPTNQYYKGC